MPPERTSSGFGQMLRESRERRGVSLRQIANATKISVGVLEALERNDISKLPGGIFGRAFVRSYAIEVGLDPEATIQAFIAQFPNETVIAGHSTSDRAEDNLAVESDRQTAGTFLWLIAIAVPIAAALLYFTTLGRRTSSENVPPAPTAVTGAAEPATAAPLATAGERPAAAPATAAPAVAAPAAPAVGATAAAVAPAAAAASTAPSPAATPPSVAARPEAGVTTGDRLTVAMTARRPCWVSATVDGKKTIERLLQTGEQQTVTVTREMVLTAGDASAIAMQLNGADGRPLGKAGEVVTARINLTNYKDYLQAR
jgi:cytoskeleton protein RodZ